MTINSTDSTLRPSSLDAPKPSQSLVSQVNGDGTVRAEGTVRADGVQTQEANVDDNFFFLKGEKYRKIQSLSDNTGEAQVFLVERNGESFVLKIYYPNFDVNKKILQTVYNFDFEMIVKVFDFGKTYVDGKHRYYELMEYLQGGTMSDYRLNGDMDKFRRIALQGAAARA